MDVINATLSLLPTLVSAAETVSNAHLVTAHLVTATTQAVMAVGNLLLSILFLPAYAQLFLSNTSKATAAILVVPTTSALAVSVASLATGDARWLLVTSLPVLTCLLLSAAAFFLQSTDQLSSDLQNVALRVLTPIAGVVAGIVAVIGLSLMKVGPFVISSLSNLLILPFQKAAAVAGIVLKGGEKIIGDVAQAELAAAQTLRDDLTSLPTDVAAALVS